MPTHTHRLDRSLGYWLQTLGHHAPSDTKEILEDVSIVIAILAAKCEPGPQAAFTNDLKTRSTLWRKALWDILAGSDKG
jgi:hypothetical protein